VVAGSALVMALAQMGSLNALEQTQGNRFWHRWLQHSTLPSADVMGTSFSSLDCTALRGIMHHLYSRLKRNKALHPAFSDNLFALVVDGHESSASYLRSCVHCLQREITTAKGVKVQYYHRSVMAILLCKEVPLLLDIEMQLPGEDEIAAATRLMQRMFLHYARAFDVVIADGLYARAPFFHTITSRGKHVIAVLKDDRRDLMKDALALFNQQTPIVLQHDKVMRQCWDMEGFATWPQVAKEVRVVSSIETTTVCRQKTGKSEEILSRWMWVSTISKQSVPTETFVLTAHGRWDIENKAFNELTTYWHANHVYKHALGAIEAFWLITMLAYTLFHAFVTLNLKPIIRTAHTKLHLARLVAAELYSGSLYCHSP
jgi:hypothetical protein